MVETFAHKEPAAKCQGLLYGIFFVIFVGIHSVLPMHSDDLLYSRLLDEGSLADTVSMRYSMWSGRVLIDLVLALIMRSFWCWKVMDALVMTLLVWVMNKLVFTRPTAGNVLITFLVVMLYPFNDMRFAGFGASTVNYLWPLTFLLVSLVPIVCQYRGDGVSKWLSVLSGCAAIIAAGHEQSACILFGVGIVAFLYFLHEGQRYGYALLAGCIGLAGIVFSLTCPGNYLRLVAETQNYYPLWDEVNLVEKAYLALASTTYLMLNNFAIMAACCSLALIVIWCRGGSRACKWGSVCVALFLIAIFAYRAYCIATHNHSVLFEYRTLDANPFNGSLLVVGLLMCLALLWCVWAVWRDKPYIPVGILLVGLASHFIMGMSPTVFISGARTMIFLYFAVLILILLMVREFHQDVPRKLRVFLVSACVAYVCAKYAVMVYGYMC